MVSYDVTELITSKHIRSTKRSLSVVAICVNEHVSTQGKTQHKVKKKNPSKLRLKYEKRAVIKSKSTRLYWNSQDCSVKEFLVFGSGMRGEVVKSILCGPN